MVTADGAQVRRRHGSVPRWFVTARHGVRVAQGSKTQWPPFSTHHAREAGSAVTRCGLPALDWAIFWEMPFDAFGEGACCECSSIDSGRGLAEA